MDMNTLWKSNTSSKAKAYTMSIYLFLFFSLKNTLRNNIEGEIFEILKDILRIYQRLRF